MAIALSLVWDLAYSVVLLCGLALVPPGLLFLAFALMRKDGSLVVKHRVDVGRSRLDARLG